MLVVAEDAEAACRHSQSKAIRVEFYQEGNHICVSVRDWGKGFDPEGVTEGCFGLQGIRERARLLGGRASIVTAPSRGTHVRVELPLIERTLPKAAAPPG